MRRDIPSIHRRVLPQRALWGVVAVVIAMVAAMLTIGPASAQPASGDGSPPVTGGVVVPYGTQRGPDPTVASIEASRGPFATAQVSVAPGNGFNGGVVYYPTDQSLGTWGALAIVPGYTAKCANEEAWMGPWLSSFGFVVICIETNSTTDFDVARGQELLAALNWLTTASPVKGEIDPGRLAVLGHSMGGGGVVYATEHQPSLKAAVALAPFSPSQDMSTDHVPTLVIGGQDDTVVTPSYLSGLYATMPASTQSDFAQIAGASHVYYTQPNNVEMKLIIPWLKLFVDSDTRYEQFLCPSLPDPSSISEYQPKCPYTPTGGSTGSPSASASASVSASASASASATPPPPGACSAVYQTQNSWPGGFQGLVTVTAGSAPISSWSVKWNLASGQSITQLWNGTLTASGSAITVTNASYNGALAAGGSTTFGFTANGSPSAPILSCAGS
jgi:hypothetical protein